MRPDDLYSSPNALAGAYSRFRVADRLLLTGHSHQAWPDRGFAAQQQAWLDAAAFVDDKWPLVFAGKTFVAPLGVSTFPLDWETAVSILAERPRRVYSPGHHA